MKIGYNEATARDCPGHTLEDDLRLCEQHGFDFIEIRMDMLRSYLTRHSLDDLKRFFAASRLKPHAMNAFYLYPELLGDRDDPVKRQMFMDELLLGCLAAREIGSRHAVVVAPLQRDPKGGPYRGTWDETYRECVRILRILSDIMGFYGINICFELVGFDRSGVRTIEQADAIIRAVDRDNVGFVFDSYNIHLYNKTNDYSIMKRVEPQKIFAVHINNADDVPMAEMGQDKRRLCDKGGVNLPGYLATLREIGYDGMVSIETFRPEYWTMNAEQVIGEAYRTTREVMAANGVL